MKTWRERIAEARERGHFLAIDQELAMDYRTCACGEMAERFGVEATILGTIKSLAHPYWPKFRSEGHQYGGLFPNLVEGNLISEAETCLEEIEDAALKMKRGF